MSPVVIKKLKGKGRIVKHPCAQKHGTVRKGANDYYFCSKCGQLIPEKVIRSAFDKIGEDFQEPKLAPVRKKRRRITRRKK